MELNWIHPQTKQRSLMTDPDILHGAEFTMNSYVSHAFELRELPSKRTKECLVPGQCKTVNFAVNHNDKQGERENGLFPRAREREQESGFDRYCCWP